MNSLDDKQSAADAGLVADSRQAANAQAGNGGEAPDSRFRTLFDVSPDAIFVEDLNGKVLDANPAACRLHRMSREELVGLTVDELIPPEHRAEGRRSFGRLASGEETEIEGFSYTSDGEAVPVSVRACRFDYRGEPALLFHVNDLTRQRSLEAQLLQSQKMEAIGHLAGGVAHDFNNLLTVILGYTELCMASLTVDHRGYGDLLEVQAACEQAAKLTRQLLAFSRQQVLAPRVLDLNKVVSSIEELSRRTIGDNVRLTIRLGCDLKSVRVDESQLVQVILNLALNSRDAMPDGGDIVLETGNLSLAKESLREGFIIPAGEYVRLTLSDTGTGMPEAVRKKAFEPFFTTKEPDKGTGLGLSTVYGIVKQSGGFIGLESEPGRGTTMDILLPSVEGEAEETPSRIEIEPADGVERTILLTEDNEVVRRLAQKALEREGYRVIGVSSAEEALEFCDGGGERIDLLVTDLVLAGLDGLSLARQVIESRPQTRVLLMSGHSKEARFNSEALMEDTSFLQKPFTPSGLTEAVAGALRDDARPSA